MTKYQIKKVRARQRAIRWQTGVAQESMSYLEVAEWNAYWCRQAFNYGLFNEFRENGIL